MRQTARTKNKSAVDKSSSYNLTIPKGWVLKELRDEIDELEAGVSVNSTDDDTFNGDLCILKTSSISNGFFLPQECKKIKTEDVEKAKLNPKKNSIIISRMNTPSLVGECGYVSETYQNLFLPDRLWQTRFNKNSQINVKWLNYLLNTPEYKLKIKSVATGTSNSMKNISKEAFLSIKFLLPPIPEQKSIAQILSTWDNAIETTQKLIAKKELRKKWLMQMLLTGKKRLKDFNIEWSKIGAGEVFKSVATKGLSNEELLSATQDRGMIPRTMLEGRVTMPTSGTEGFKLVEKGDFVISLRSFQGGLEYSYYRGIVSPAYTVLKPKKLIYEEFYKHYFKSNDFIGRLAVAVIGIRDGKQISYDDFCTVKIPYPNIAEQKAIAKALQAADKEIELLIVKCENLKNQKKGLMQKLLTGKIRLKK